MDDSDNNTVAGYRWILQGLERLSWAWLSFKPRTFRFVVLRKEKVANNCGLFFGRIPIRIRKLVKVSKTLKN